MGLNVVIISYRDRGYDYNTDKKKGFQFTDGVQTIPSQHFRNGSKAIMSLR